MPSESNYWQTLWARRVSRRALMRYSALGAGGLAAAAVVGCEEEEKPGVATATPTPALAPSGTFRLSMQGDIDDFDVHVNQLIIFESAIRLPVFNTLVRYNERLELEPDLAESFEATPDATSYTFKLREGVQFHNGRVMTAEDVKLSYERIAGLESIWAARVQNVDTIEVLSPTEVRMNLKQPSAAFLDDVAFLAIIPPETADQQKTNPIGTGAFRFVEWIPNDRIRLEAFDGYFKPGKPKFKELILRILPEIQTAISNLEAGAIDGILEVPISNAVQFEGSADITIQRPPFSNSFHLFEMMGTNPTITGDKRVRQALAFALDKEAIRRTVFEGQGEIQWSPLPSGMFAYEEQTGFPFDIQKAKQLLADAGVPDFEFTLEVPLGFPEGERVATVWQANLREAGVTMNINLTEISAWLDKYITRTYDATWNLFNVSGDPNSFFDIILKPHLADKYDNPEVERLIQEGNSTPDQDLRREAYVRLQEIVVDELPIIIVQSVPLQSLTRSTVKGYKLNGLGHAILDEVSA